MPHIFQRDKQARIQQQVKNEKHGYYQTRRERIECLLIKCIYNKLMNHEQISRRSLIEELLFEVNEKERYIQLYDECRQKYRLLEAKYELLMQQYKQILGFQFNPNAHLVQEVHQIQQKNLQPKIKSVLKVTEFHTQKIKDKEEFESNKKNQYHYVNLSERTQQHLKNKIKERQQESLSTANFKDPKKIYVNQLREEISALSNSLASKNKLVISKERDLKKEEKSVEQNVFKKEKPQGKVLKKQQEKYWVEMGSKHVSMKKKKSPYAELQEQKKHRSQMDKKVCQMNEQDRKDESMIVKQKRGAFNDSMIAIIDELGE